MPVDVASNPEKVRAGRLGARARWGDHAPRTIALDDLTPEQRLLVRRLVEAVRAAPSVAEAATAAVDGDVRGRGEEPRP